MNCVSCSRPKAELHSQKSKLLPSINLVLCNDCKKKGYEPRYLVILAGRAGVNVADYIANKRYMGDDILAKEIIKARR